MVTHYNRNNDSDESEDITQVNTPGDDSMSDVGTEHDPDEDQVNGNGERKEPRSTTVDKESPKPANNNKMPSSDKKRSAVSKEDEEEPNAWIPSYKRKKMKPSTRSSRRISESNRRRSNRYEPLGIDDET